MHQPTKPRRSTRTVRVYDELDSSSDDSQDSSVTRVYVPNSNQIYQSSLSSHTVPLPTSTSLMINSRSNIGLSATQENSSNQVSSSKPARTFADTQLLSIYYLNQNINNLTDPQDNSVFFEEKKRQPTLSRAVRDPSTSNQPIVNSPSVLPRQLSTRGSTLVIDANQQLSSTNESPYEQHLKIHSGSQRLINNQSLNSDNEENLSPNDFVEESRFSYEEYVINVDNNQGKKTLQQLTSPSPTSNSSVTTIVAQPSSTALIKTVPQPPQVSTRKMLQPEEIDSDRTSRLSGDEINTHSSVSSMSGSFTNQDWQTGINPSSLSQTQTAIVRTEPTTRISSWPPAPYDIPPVDAQFETSFVLDESDQQRRPSRVQFAEQLVRVIPPSATNSFSEDSAPSSLQLPPTVMPRTSMNRSNTSDTNEQRTEMDIDEDSSTTTTTTTTNSNNIQVQGRLQRTSGVTNLNEMMIKRPSVAPPPPPPPLPAVPPVSLSTKNTPVDPKLVQEQLKRFDYQLVVDTKPPVNQSKWVKDHMDVSDIPQVNPTSGRVEALRSMFEQQSTRSSDSSTVTSPITTQGRYRDPEERPSKHGDEIRFRIKEDSTVAKNHSTESINFSPRRKPNTNNSNASPPAPLTWEALLGVQNEQKQHQQKDTEVISSTYPSSIDLDEIRQITGRRIKTLDEIGFVLQDRKTWKWHESFWRSLTPRQQEQLRAIGTATRSRQTSGDTQIYEYSDRSAYHGDSEDNTARVDYSNRRTSPFQSRGSSQENLSTIINNRLFSNEDDRRTPTTPSDRGSTVSVTGAGAWQNSQPPPFSTGIGKYSESSNFHEIQPSVSIFGSTPTGPRTRVGSQESIASSTKQQSTLNNKGENQMTVIESGYSSADEPAQRTAIFRPNSSTIIEEPSISHHSENHHTSGGFGTTTISSGNYLTEEYPIYENLRPEFQDSLNESDIDPYSYEQFVYDYVSSNSRRVRSENGTLILMIDGQQIQFPNIRLPSNSDLTLSKNIYLDAIDELPPPFETELDELVIFIQGEPVILPTNRWSHYRQKYSEAQWIHKLDRVNRRLPSQLSSAIEQWLSAHSTFLLESNEINVDGLGIPLIGRLGSHILDMYQIRGQQPIDDAFWNEVLKYLIRSGYVSFDNENQLVNIAQSQLEARRLLTDRVTPSPQLVERVANHLRALDQIHFDSNDGRLILGDLFSLSHEDIADLFEIFQEGQNLNANELAVRLLQICDIEEDQDGKSLILTLEDQVLQLPPPKARKNDIRDRSTYDTAELERWLRDNLQCSIDDDQTLLFRYRTTPNYIVRVSGSEGLRLSNLLQRQALQYRDLSEWHENHIQIDQTPGQSLRMIIKPNKNIEIVNLETQENIKGREKMNEEKTRLTNEKSRKRSESNVSEGVEEKSLVFFIPLHSQTSTDNEEEKKEREKTSSRQHSISSTSSSPSTLPREEQKKVKRNSDNDANAKADDDKERTLFLQSIASVLHFINANGSNVGTLELIQGRRLKLTLTGNSPISLQQQSIEFDERDTDILVNDLQLDIDAWSDYLVNQILDEVRFDSQGEYLFLKYREQMLKLKSLKEKLLPSSSKKMGMSKSTDDTSTTKPERKILDTQQVATLTNWLEQLNADQFIEITEQNDIVILPEGEENLDEQIFIKHDDVDRYMDEKLRENKSADPSAVIGMEDIARILLIHEYVQYKDGGFSYGTRRIAVDRNELEWLLSIIRGVRPDNRNRETEVDLFDGLNTQVLRIPYEHMQPTNNPRTVADYLFQNGTVRYDLETTEYAYRYVPPDIPLDDEISSTENQGQREILSSHIRHIHVDEQNQRVEIEFIGDPKNRLSVPKRFFDEIQANDYNRMYIIDLLLANGGKVQSDTFIFNNHKHSLQVPRISSSTNNLASENNLQTLKLSTTQRKELIQSYVDLISKQDGIKRDNQNDLILLVNTADDSQLYLTPEDSDTVAKNQSRRTVASLLNKTGELQQDEFGNVLLHYNKQYVQLPSSIVPPDLINNRSSNFFKNLGQKFGSRSNDNVDDEFRSRLAQETRDQFIERYHDTISYMYQHGLIICNRRLKLVQLHFSNKTLTIPLEHLKSIIDPRVLNNTAENVLPFESRDLSQWLLENSDTISNSREGYIQLTHKNRVYNFPLINTDNQRTQRSSGIASVVQRFGLRSRSPNGLSRLDLNTIDKQKRCAAHLLEHLDKFGGININNDTRRLILSMTPDNAEQLIVENPVIPVTKETLINYLITHGRFALTSNRNDIEYRYRDDGHIYHFHTYIKDWENAFDETNEERILRVLGEILSLNARFLQRSDRQIIIILRNSDRFIIPSQIGAQLMGPVNGQTIAELLMKYADDIYEEENGKFLVIRLVDQTLRLNQDRQLMSSKPSTTGNTTGNDTKLKLLFPFNKSLRQIQKTASTSTLNVQPPDASNGYAIDPLLMLANYVYRAGTLYQDDMGRLVIKMNEDEIVVPRIEAINAIEAINTSPNRTGTIIARLIDRIGKVQSNKAGGLIVTIGKSSFELPKELLDRANQLHRETIDIENDLPVADQDIIQSGLNGSMTLTGRRHRHPTAAAPLPNLRQSKSVGSLTSSTVGHPWFTDDQQVLYNKDGRGDARYLNLDNFPLGWQKDPHKHGIDCEVKTIKNVAPYLNVLGYTEDGKKKGVTINELARLHPEMLSRGKMSDNAYLSKLEDDRAQVKKSLCPKPRIIVIPDEETMLSSNPQTRIYVQYMYENDAVLGTDPAYVMMLPSRYPVRPTRPQLIAPHHYRDIALREAPVYVRKNGEDVYFENLPKYLATEHPTHLPSSQVRRMLKLDNRDEYSAYLRESLPVDDAERLVRESDEQIVDGAMVRYTDVPNLSRAVARLGRPREENEDDDFDDENMDDQYHENGSRGGSIQGRTYYNISNAVPNINNEQRNRASSSQFRQNGGLKGSLLNNAKFIERSPSTSSQGSDMIISSNLPSQRNILGNATSSNIPSQRRDVNRSNSNNPLSSLTDENYGRPVNRTPK